MPQARSSRSKSSAKPKSGGAQTKRSPAGSSAAATRAKRSSARPAGGSKSTGGARSAQTKASSGSPDARLEAAAQRLRKLNERIIEAGKGAGETTLSSYEKALKTIASTLERGAGSTDIEWISHLATAQAKFIRDVTAAWTSAARGVLK